MKYRDLLKAAGGKNKPPTISTHNWKKEERERIDLGLCIVCGEKPSCKCSFLCRTCETKNSMEEIRSELEVIKRRVLRK
jgi:hypothetical protein